jgi:hypothetical protein
MFEERDACEQVRQQCRKDNWFRKNIWNHVFHGAKPFWAVSQKWLARGVAELGKLFLAPQIVQTAGPLERLPASLQVTKVRVAEIEPGINYPPAVNMCRPCDIAAETWQSTRSRYEH